MNIRLRIEGRQDKLANHQATVTISELLAYYLDKGKMSGPLVAKDSDGFELGGEVRLGQLTVQPSDTAELVIEQETG